MVNKKDTYVLDYSDETYTACIICSVTLSKINNKTFSLSANQKSKILRKLSSSNDDSDENSDSNSASESEEEKKTSNVQASITKAKENKKRKSVPGYY